MNHRQYRRAAHYNITHVRRQSFYSLPSAHIDLLSDQPFSLPQTFQAVDNAIDSNADIAEAILNAGLQLYEIDPDDESWHGKATPNDVDKARTTINQLYRDWSTEGQPERHAVYLPIFNALAALPPPLLPITQQNYNILVPGAGLGRIVLELCGLGYTVTGNEISYHQLLASFYILNCTQRARQHTLYPWALKFSNHMTRADQLQSVSIPDVTPADELAANSVNLPGSLNYGERLSMTAGDFVVIYRHDKYESHFYAVVTCFFIDTAPNILNYIETIRHCLQPGGIWINIGPLKWHFESSPTPAEREKLDQRGERVNDSHIGSLHHTSHNFSCPISPEQVSPVVTGAQQHSSMTSEHSRAERDNSDWSTVTSKGIGEPGSFELSNDEVTALVQRLGFEMIENSQAPAGATGYIRDPRSMLQHVYRPAFWVARKP